MALPVPPPATARSQQPAVRARLAPISDDDLAARSGDSADMAEKRRKMRLQLQKMEDREHRLKARYQKLTEHAKYGRVSVHMLMWGVRAQALAVLLQIAGAAGTVLVSNLYGAILAQACIGFGGLATLLILGGFGFGIAGPEKGRHIGIMGVIVTIVLAVMFTIQFFRGLEIIALTDYAPVSWSETMPIWNAFAPGTEMAMLAEQPARILKDYPYSIFGTIAAAIEFTRLVMIALMIQVYATEAKEVELGHQSINTVSNLFWVVLLAAMFRISAAFGFDWAQPEEMWATIGMGVHAAITSGSLLGIGLAYFKLGQVMNDVVDVVDPRRLVETDEKSAT